MELDDRLRVGRGDLLDIDSSPGGEHQEVLLGGPIEREAGVVLLVDVGGMLDPQPLDGVTLDVHPEDGAGVGAHLVGVVGELDAPSLAAPTDLDLSLDNDRVAGRFGHGDGLVDSEGDTAGAHRDAEAGEVLLALVFEQIHAAAH